jgi:hypothetical protein
VLLAVRPYILGKWSPPTGEQTQDDRNAGTVERQATPRVAAPTEGRQKITGAGNVKAGHRETRRNRQESLNGDWVTTEKRTREVAGGKERTSEYTLRPPYHSLTVITENADSNLVTQGWVVDQFWFLRSAGENFKILGRHTRKRDLTYLIG